MKVDLEAKDAIRDLVLRYCRAVDRKDYKALEPLYHKDSVDEHGAMFSGSGQEFIDWLPGMLESMKVTSHMVTNHLVTVSGEEAEGEVTVIAYHLSHDNEEMVIGGRYLDRYILADGRWQFMYRKIVMDWNQMGPSSCDMTSPVVAGTPVGARQEEDPSNTFFKFLEK